CPPHPHSFPTRRSSDLDIVKTRGEKVSTVEVESVLHALAGVKQAAVVGVPDDLLGEAVRAYVVLDGNAGLTQEDILRFARTKLRSEEHTSELQSLAYLV